MTAETASERSRSINVREWLGRAEQTLDQYGAGAWIAATIVGFILFLPIGLGILIYMIWSGRMGCRGKYRGRWRHRAQYGSTGNAAFDAYREETLQRLEDERQAFEDFMERLRKAKDQAEFDQFMTERRQNNSGPAGQPTGV